MEHLARAEEHEDLVRVGDYELLEDPDPREVGDVSRVRLFGSSLEVELWCLHRGEFASPEEEHRFHRRLELAASVSHPCLARPLGWGRVDERLVLAAEWPGGRPLADWVAAFADGERDPVPGLVVMLARIADVIRFAHARGVLHGRLEPVRVRVHGGGEPRLSGLGLPDETGRFAAGRFGAPELLGGAESPDLRADVFSLGELGRALFEEGRSAWRAPGVLDSALESVIARATSHDRERRQSSVCELVDDLRGLGA